MATTESELENINSLTNEIRDAAEDLDPRKLGLGDLIQSVRDSQRNDADIRANIQRSLQNEEINANNIRGLNSLLQDSLESQNRILQEIKTLAVSIDSMSESLSNAANNNGVGPNNQALGGVPSQGGNMASLGSLLGAGAIGAIGATGLGFISNLFGGQGTALMGNAQAASPVYVSSSQSSFSQSQPYNYSNTTSPVSSSQTPGSSLAPTGDAIDQALPSDVRDVFKRDRFREELKDPNVLRRLQALTLSEVGYKDTETQMALMETLMNRVNAHPGTYGSLMEAMGSGNSSYYAPFHSGGKFNQNYNRLMGDPALQAQMDKVTEQVLAGSNYSNFGTQNSSGSVAASAARSQTITGTGRVYNSQETWSRKDRPEYSGIHGAGVVREEQRWFAETKQRQAAYQAARQQALQNMPQQAPNQLTSNLEMPQGAQMPEGASQQPAGGSTGGGPGTDAVSASPSIAEDPMSKYRQFTGTVANLSDREKQQISKLQKFAKLAGISEQSVGLMKVMNNPAELKKYIDGLAPEDREKVLGDLDKLSNDERFKPSEGLEKALGQVQGILQKPPKAQEGQGQEESEGGGGKGGVQGQPQEGLSLSGSQQGAQEAQASKEGNQGAQASKEGDSFSALDRYRAEKDLAKRVTGDEDADYYRSSLSRRNGKIDALEQEVLNKKQNQIYEVNNDDNDKVDPQTQADAQLLSDWDRLSEKGAELSVSRGGQPSDSDHQTKVQSLSDQIDNLSKDRLDAAKALYGPQLYDQHGNTTEAYFAAINKQVKDAQKQTRTIQDEATKNAIDDNNDSSGADTDPGSSTASATKPAGDVSLKGRGESFAASLETTQGYDTTEQTSINPNAKPVSSSLV